MATTYHPHGFEKEYSEQHFWESLHAHARLAGRDVVERALQLYHTGESRRLPGRALPSTAPSATSSRPSRLSPDIPPIVGYMDDLGLLVATLAAVMPHVTPAAMDRAGHKTREWFP